MLIIQIPIQFHDSQSAVDNNNSKILIMEIQYQKNQYNYSFLNDIFDIEYQKYYSLIESLELYQLKNIYMFLYLRSLKMNRITNLEEMELHKYVDQSETLDQILKEYIQEDKIKAIFIMNSIQLYFFPRIIQ